MQTGNNVIGSQLHNCKSTYLEVKTNEKVKMVS